uniref:hypothetical protein n=1 Tax=Marinobacterium profundum TaxID=1714300 RepID=UPI00082B220D|nr:hypothetical protein [Marinobacterium profundum]
MSALLGALVGVLFIFVQPWFGMDTLTSRHAALYQQLGGWSAVPALVIAWLAHSAVSVFYGVLSGILILKTQRLPLVAFFTLAFSWVTTVIAPPANALIVQLVSFQRIDVGKLPGLNFDLDVKFVLHLVFFAAIVLGLFAYQRKSGTAEVSR